MIDIGTADEVVTFRDMAGLGLDAASGFVEQDV